VFKRAYVQLRRRTAFMATPPKIWIFLIILGLFSAVSLCVPGAPLPLALLQREVSSQRNEPCRCAVAPAHPTPCTPHPLHTPPPCSFAYDSLLKATMEIRTVLRDRLSKHVRLTCGGGPLHDSVAVASFVPTRGTLHVQKLALHP
jgi:hypothetical protein